MVSLLKKETIEYAAVAGVFVASVIFTHQCRYSVSQRALFL